MFCEGYIETFTSVWDTLLAFLGGLGHDPLDPIFNGKIPPYMEKINIAFLKEAMNYELVERPIKELDYDPNLI